MLLLKTLTEEVFESALRYISAFVIESHYWL
jgi:hypothetical protein